jgi:pimeloyl-ACP methyl ester carboxylesterase
VQAIWLTPLLTDPELEAQVQQYHPRSLFILGTEDPYYHEETLARWVKATQAETLVIPGADHLLEVSEGTIASLHVMEQVVQAIQAFLSHEP